MLCPTVALGRSGPVVPRLIFGTEHIIHLSPEEGGALLNCARRECGLYHWDTAPAYNSQPHVAAGLRLAGRERVVVTSKIPSMSVASARQDLEAILRELATDYLDVCFLHNVKAGEYEDRLRALEYLVRAREQGLVRHVGISSHVPAILHRAAGQRELEIACGTFNQRGSWIDGGAREDMGAALSACYAAGKGVYVIKVLGVGELAGDVRGAVRFAMGQPFVHSCNIGMRNLEEVTENVGIIREMMGEIAT